jgi:hypothetical protein
MSNKPQHLNPETRPLVRVPETLDPRNPEPWTINTRFESETIYARNQTRNPQTSVLLGCKLSNDRQSMLSQQVHLTLHCHSTQATDAISGGAQTLKRVHSTQATDAISGGAQTLKRVHSTQATDAISGGAAWLHIDMFDGVEIDSPDAFTFGPPMVKFLRKHTEGTPLDVHLVAARPLRYVEVSPPPPPQRVPFAKSR